MYPYRCYLFTSKAHPVPLRKRRSRSKDPLLSTHQKSSVMTGTLQAPACLPTRSRHGPACRESLDPLRGVVSHGVLHLAEHHMHGLGEPVVHLYLHQVQLLDELIVLVLWRGLCVCHEQIHEGGQSIA